MTIKEMTTKIADHYGSHKAAIAALDVPARTYWCWRQREISDDRVTVKKAVEALLEAHLAKIGDEQPKAASN